MERHNMIQPSVTLPPLVSPTPVTFKATGNNSLAARAPTASQPPQKEPCHS